MDELTDWLKLAHSPGLGIQTVLKLLEFNPSPKNLIRSSESELAAAGFSKKCIALLKQPVSTELKTLDKQTRHWLSNRYNSVITWNDSCYPKQLKPIHDPPVLLYVSGDPSILASTCIALVGSRRASRSALKHTATLSADLASQGVTVISGMAKGIDAQAHQACLDTNSPTIAVAGTGLNHVYPSSHRSLAREICESGAVVSEFPLDALPRPWHFPRRNRIISGLSSGVVVIEAALKSGTLTTARHALEQGREVMAVPGFVANPLTQGCHHLIREGAILVQTATDILAEIAPQIDRHPPTTAGSTPNKGPMTKEKDAGTSQLLECLGYDPASIDTLVSRSGRPAADVAQSILELELEGHIMCLGAGRYIRC